MKAPDMKKKVIRCRWRKRYITGSNKHSHNLRKNYENMSLTPTHYAENESELKHRSFREAPTNIKFGKNTKIKW